MFSLSRICSALLLCSCVAAAADFALKDGDTVVFYGDSITDQRLYTTFAEAYVVTRFPKMHVKFVHSGWGGDRVSGGGGGAIDLRLQRDVITYQPTVVTIMLGMNDGSYRAYDPEIFNTFSKGYGQIVKSLKTALPGVRITVIQPSPYDDVTRKPTFDPGYNSVLLQYSAYIRDLARKENLSTADLNTEVVAALVKANATDPENAQKIIADRVHPGPAGHLLMAEALLKSWGATAVVSDVELDAAAGSAVRSNGTAVSAIERHKNWISWTQLDEALPMPVDWKDPLIKLAAASSDFVDALDQQPLKVTGLAPGAYTLTIDGTPMGDYTPEQLAAGVNLAVLPTPMLQQALEVARLTMLHNNVHFARWRTIQVPVERYTFSRTAQALADMDALEGEMVESQRAEARPKPRRYELILK